VNAIATAAGVPAKKDEELDYTPERQLELITAALRNDKAKVFAELAKLGKTDRDLGEVLRKVWREGEVLDGGYELKVRAAEALGVWSIAVGESKSAVVRRLSSKHWEHRMRAARAVRASSWPEAARLLEGVARDSFRDDNGSYLVREAANSRVVRVFISPTFRDFGAERDLLMKRVFPGLRRRARARFVEVIGVDLRWGITEEESEKGETLPICLREIERSRP
jgi:hypothetical protein